MNLSRSLAFIKAINACQGAEQVGRYLVRLASEFGFSSAFGRFVPNDPRAPQAAIGPLILVQHFPDEWTTRYNDRCYLFGGHEEVWGVADEVGPTAVCCPGAPTCEAA